jgi:hypothetical protein
VTDDDLMTTKDVASGSYRLAVAPKTIPIRYPYLLPYFIKRKKRIKLENKKERND